VKLTTNLRLVSRLRIRGAKPLLPNTYPGTTFFTFNVAFDDRNIENKMKEKRDAGDGRGSGLRGGGHGRRWW